MADSSIVIRKYENRRLYDTAASRYVNLEDVARLVREGRDVSVVDARTGEDVTRLVLAQVILEEARTKESGLPLDFLREIIRASDRATREFLQWSLTAALEHSQKMQDIWRQQISQGISAPWSGGFPWPSASSLPFWPFGQNTAPPAEASSTEAPREPDSQAAAPAPTDPAGAAGTEIEDLRRRLDQLEARVARQRPTRKKPGRKPTNET
jgi:polyhydroxyalkanoate synthesis repressor PhaR